MKSIIKLTKHDGTPILIGVDSIIQAEAVTRKVDGTDTMFTKIESRHAMVTSNWVKESVDEIYKLINS
jgi:hypothetical protein